MTSTWPSPTIAVPSAHDRERASARAQGYAAGWSHGAQAAQASVAEAGERRQRAREAGVAAERSRLERAVAALVEAAAQLEQRTAPVLAEASDAVLDIALQVAAAVLGHEALSSSTSGRGALARALDVADTGGALRVRLHPLDVGALTAEQRSALEPRVTFVTDISLDRGDAMVEHDDGLVDLRLRAALDRVRAVLLP